jgi:hypothetical protein
MATVTIASIVEGHGWLVAGNTVDRNERCGRSRRSTPATDGPRRYAASSCWFEEPAVGGDRGPLRPGTGSTDQGQLAVMN